MASGVKTGRRHRFRVRAGTNRVFTTGNAQCSAGSLTGTHHVTSARWKINMDPKWDWPLIAIVDDDEFVCRAIKRLLSLHGMDATIFSSGRTFVDLLDVNLSFVPDCVILDVQMPDLNGLELQKLLASKRPGTPVIFITAEENPHQIAQALVAGAEAVFPKPFDGDLVISTLREVLEPRTNRKQ